MRFWLRSAFLALPMLGAVPSTGTEAPGKSRRFQIDLIVRHGDPLGEPDADFVLTDRGWPEPRELDPPRTLAKASLVAREGERVSFRCQDEKQPRAELLDGKWQELGYRIYLVPSQLERGRIHLDVTMSYTEDRSRVENGVIVHSLLHLGERIYHRNVYPGKVSKLRWGEGKHWKQTWVELKVRGMAP